MGKGKSPTSNELKFVYEMIAEGYSDTDILAKYEELKRHGKLGSLPYRQDTRFIRQRRKEFETARKILEGKFKVTSVPDFVIKHWDDLAKTAKQFVSIWTAYLDSGRLVTGYIVDIDSAEFEHFTLENGYRAQLLLRHLKAEFPGEFSSITEWKQLLQDPLPPECFKKLLLVANRRTFQGTCEICQDWG